MVLPPERGQHHLRGARESFATGRSATLSGDERAESYLRDALKEYWSAMNWLEDSSGFEIAHTELHEVGRFTREHFAAGCRLEETDKGDFVQTCPVVLAHKRFGLSIGATGNAICSICSEDASECPHFPGRRYEVEASRRDGQCTVCRTDDCREHLVGEVYATEAIVMVTEANLREVSIVSRPAMPDARFMSVPLTRQDAEEVLGPLPRGAHLSCDRCLGPCQGFDELPS